MIVFEGGKETWRDDEHKKAYDNDFCLYRAYSIPNPTFHPDWSGPSGRIFPDPVKEYFTGCAVTDTSANGRSAVTERSGSLACFGLFRSNLLIRCK